MDLFTHTMDETIKERKILDRYLLQIHRIKLQDYIQRALIAPDSYFDDEIEKDIQSKNPNFLAVSDGYLKELDEHQILVEIILTDEEIAKLHQVGEVSYFDFPLPITRIKKIYVQDKDVKQHILVNVQNNEKGFLSESLMDVYLKKNKRVLQAREYTSLDFEDIPNDYQAQVTQYDKRMGMFAFMKNTNLYYYQTTDNISNYSDSYFGALSSYTNLSLFDTKGFVQLGEVFKKFDNFKTLLYSTQQINEPFLETIAEKIEDIETKEIFSGLLKENGVRKTLPQLLEKDLGLYLIGLVYYFRKKDANKKDNFKIEIEKLIPAEVAEVSLAVLGMYLGYTHIRPIETVEIKDTYFREIFGSEFNMKFRLNSKLDYVTIESIYNYCFNDKQKTIEFPYLIYPKSPLGFTLPNDDFCCKYEVMNNQTVLDAPYLKIKKLSDSEISQKRLDGYPDEIELGKHYIFSYFAKYFAIQNDPKMVCSKHEFLEILNEITPEQYRELTCLFEADGK
jgi:hypothetical protein